MSFDRSQINAAFLRALKSDFAEHGLTVIQSVRVSNPERYLEIVAKLLPKEISIGITVSPLDGLNVDQLELLLSRLAGCERYLEANSTTVEAIALPGELIGIHKDIID